MTLNLDFAWIFLLPVVGVALALFIWVILRRAVAIIREAFQI